jgi:hypothetical protein
VGNIQTRNFLYEYKILTDINGVPQRNLKKEDLEMSTRNIKIIMFLRSKVRPVRKASNLTAICEPIV